MRKCAEENAQKGKSQSLRRDRLFQEKGEKRYLGLSKSRAKLAGNFYFFELTVIPEKSFFPSHRHDGKYPIICTDWPLCLYKYLYIQALVRPIWKILFF